MWCHNPLAVPLMGWHLCLVAHCGDVIISVMASQITSLTIVYLTIYSGADQRKHQSSVSLAFVSGIHRWPVNSGHKGPVMQKMFPFDDNTVLIDDYICKTWVWKNSCGKHLLIWINHLAHNFSIIGKVPWLHFSEWLLENESSPWKNVANYPYLPFFIMMTSSNGNIFHVTGLLCWEFSGHRWISPLQRPVTWSFDVLFDLHWTNRWANNGDAGDMRRHHTHYDVIVMIAFGRVGGCVNCTVFSDILDNLTISFGIYISPSWRFHFFWWCFNLVWMVAIHVLSEMKTMLNSTKQSPPTSPFKRQPMLLSDHWSSIHGYAKLCKYVSINKPLFGLDDRCVACLTPSQLSEPIMAYC